ncbi:MAG TPA: response regulator transcription factor, partial [Chitinophagaceae bacterium]
NGIKALQQIRLTLPDLPVLIISIQTEEQYSRTMLKAGASGYLSKDAAPKELVLAVQTILQGNKYVSPQQKNIIEDKEPHKALHEQLSIRELEVLKLIATGKTLIEIGEILSVSPSTISTFRARILRKLKITNNAELARYAVANKLI